MAAGRSIPAASLVTTKPKIAEEPMAASARRPKITHAVDGRRKGLVMNGLPKFVI
jgi:hypothetical protein